MVSSQTPTIAKIKNEASENEARAMIYIAVCELCDFFNVGKTMNDMQAALTVDLIIERFWYLRLEEIKYCFRRAMMREKLFDRLDGNIILGWLREYDNERTEECIAISERDDARKEHNVDIDSDSISFDDYVALLEQQAQTDEDAAERLREIRATTPKRLTLLSREEREKKDHEFKMWKTFKYLLNEK